MLRIEDRGQGLNKSVGEEGHKSGGSPALWVLQPAGYARTNGRESTPGRGLCLHDISEPWGDGTVYV